MTTEAAATSIETPHGPLAFTDHGGGPPVLFVHGSPGGSDEGELMTRFLVAAGLRAVTPSRPGYLGTPLSDDNATPSAQAAMALALLDALQIERCGLMCWSGGGPSTYLLASTNPERVNALVALAAVSKAYTFASSADERVLEGRFGAWLMKEMARHTPKSLVKSTVGAEGSLDHHQLRAVVHEIWQDDDKRTFVLELAQIVAGNHPGLDNDRAQFPTIDDLGLGLVPAPTLLVHGTADTDVPPEHSDHALDVIPSAEILRVEGGTHLATWTDTTSDEIQARIVAHLRDTTR